MPRKKLTTSIFDPLVVEVDGQEYTQARVTEAMLQVFAEAPGRIEKEPSKAYSVICDVVKATFPDFPAETHDVRLVTQVYQWLGEMLAAALAGEQDTPAGKPERPGEA